LIQFVELGIVDQRLCSRGIAIDRSFADPSRDCFGLRPRNDGGLRPGGTPAASIV